VPSTPDPEIIARKLQETLGLLHQGKLDAAEALCREILRLDPREFNALQFWGAIAAQKNDLALALDLMGQALAINPAHAQTHYTRGRVLQSLGLHEDALAAFDATITHAPAVAEAHAARAQELYALRQYDAARAAADQAIALNDRDPMVHNTRAAALAALRYYAAAVEGYDRAVAMAPDFALAYVNRGHALRELGRFEEAAASFETALRLDPAIPFLRGARLQARLWACLWENLDTDIADIKARVARGEPVTSALSALTFADDPSFQKKAAEIWTASYYPFLGQAAPAYPRHDKIRIGYFSANLHEHAFAYLAAGLFEVHDRQKFEIAAFSLGPDQQDAMRRRLSVAFDRFIDVHDKSDAEITALARELQIDIAVDLTGYTQDDRMGIFAHRVAPVQVSYLGYPGTLGADYIDYIIADAVVIPDAAHAHYAEKVVSLPGSYQVNDSRRAISDRLFSRAELGLPENGFVFCCFNHSAKIQPDIFEIWMRILRSVPGSVLWLLMDHAQAAANLRKEAEKRGVDGKRLVFASRMPLADHLARLRAADLFIDTLPYNAHTTTSDALWAGVPVLTRIGASFAGRVAASLLMAVGLPDLIVSTISDYERLAVALATDPAQLGQLRQKLAANRDRAPLFDTARFARHLEDAYTQMYARHHAGLPPDHITVL
jgi:predicted O-linked N-acetylglucosamine transferase (SPINDLY family)